MSEKFDIRAGERGVVRLFQIDLDKSDIAAFAKPDLISGRWPLKEALGVEDINEAFVDVFAVRDLDELGLIGFMAEGLGIPDDELLPHKAQLEAVDGYVAVVLSGAFKGLAVTLLPRPPLLWIGTFFENRPPVEFAPLPSGGAEPAPARKRATSNAALSGRVATLALVVIFALTALLVWVAV